MNATRVVVLVFALVAAGVAAFLVRGLVLESKTQVVAEAAPQIETVGVLVAAGDIRPGDMVRPNMLRWQQWPQDAVAPGLVTQNNNPDARNAFDGSLARRHFTQGEPVNAMSLVQPGSSGLMAALVSPGMRAMAVSVSDENSAGGFILPGDRVDVVVSREIETGGRNKVYVSETVLYNVRVLAVDQMFDEDVSGGAIVGDTITLELTPGQSETLALAQAVGDVSLALRSFADASVANEMPEGWVPNILAGMRQAADQPEQPTQTADNTGQVRIVRNGQETRVRVQGGSQ